MIERRHLGTAAAIASTLVCGGAADLGLVPPALAVAVVASILLGVLGRAMFFPVLHAWRRITRRGDRWADAIRAELVADESHLLASGPVRALATARLATTHVDDAELDAVLLECERGCREASARELAMWRRVAVREQQRTNFGILAALARGDGEDLNPGMRRFATPAAMPAVLPRRVREWLGYTLEPIDLVRLLHTAQIERLSLIATLWVRALVVAAAPGLAALTVTGAVPLTPGDSGVAVGVFVAAVVMSSVTALAAPWIAQRLVGSDDPRLRRGLLVAEQLLAAALLVSYPCWPCGVYAAGSINWWQRPDWRLCKLLAWLGINVGAAVAGALFAGSPGIGSTLIEVLIGATVISFVSMSYGLMFPIVVGTIAAVVLDELRLDQRVERDIGRVRRVVDDALSEAERGLAESLTRHPEDTELAAAHDSVRHEQTRLRATPFDPARFPRTMSAVCARAVYTVVPPIGQEPGAPVHAASFDIDGVLGAREFASRRVARAVERLIKHLAYEASARGSGLLFVRAVSHEQGRVLLTVANSLAAHTLTGEGSGEIWIDRKLRRIPDARLVSRGRGDGALFGSLDDVYIVAVSLGPAAFAPISSAAHGSRPRRAEDPGADL